VDAGQLRVGDRLQTADSGVATVAAVRDYTSSLTTYDLTVDSTHTYFVGGKSAVLVHNVDPCKLYPNTRKSWRVSSSWLSGSGSRSPRPAPPPSTRRSPRAG
jgi:hypothetical protein